MPPTSTIWQLEEQTRGKHKVLKSYLEAWFPKLATWSGRVVFIDGFAGPGEYEGHEKGSPLIALESILGHSHREKINGKVTFAFVEANRKRADHLRALVEPYREKLPKGWSLQVVTGKFDATMTEMMNVLEQAGRSLAPAFVMIDPFGVSDTPLSVIAEILKNRRAEVYISLMYEAINRHCGTPEFAPHLDALFGCTHWREGLTIDDPQARRAFLFDLYSAQLRQAGADQVVHFDLYNGNRLVYSIFFASGSWQGANTMKEAVWKIDPSGEFQFRGSSQSVLDLSSPDFQRLQEVLSEKFKDTGWVTISDVQRFVGSDQTDFHLGHLKKGALKPMEQSGQIELDSTSRSRKCTYPEGTRLRFL